MEGGGRESKSQAQNPVVCASRNVSLPVIKEPLAVWLKRIGLGRNRPDEALLMKPDGDLPSSSAAPSNVAAAHYRNPEIACLFRDPDP